MEKKEPIRMFKGKKILEGKWKEKRINYVSQEIVVAVNEEQLKQIQVAEKKEDLKRSLLEGLPKGSRILRDLNQRGRLLIEVPESEDLLAIIQLLAKHPSVKYAEPNIIGEICQVIPNEYTNFATLNAQQWGLVSVRAPWVWEITTGQERKVLIVVIDTGIAGPQRANWAVYRWWNGVDHFYCADPMGELAHGGKYVYEGAPFRLFSAKATNTTSFFRWYNGSNGDHFYTTDPTGELAPSSGYQYEGIIGNIATMQLPGTVALYRWYKPSTGDHFYTTDPGGELAPQVGYQYEGIAGYVMPIP
jgi:hypothetical protein